MSPHDVADRRDAGGALSCAFTLAARGIPTFPCLATKAPACRDGFKAATADPDKLRDLWRRHPGELIGVPTGRASGVDALDIDPRSGGDLWYTEVSNRIPATRIHRTRSGGLHVLFRHAEGVRNTAGKIAPGVDTRGDGGFIIWWPAALGQTFCAIRAREGRLPVPMRAPLAPWPEWLLGILQPPPASRQEAAARPALPADAGRRARYVEAAIRRATEAVATAPEGQRNHTLNTETFGLSRFIPTGDLTPHEVSDLMAEAAHAAGLTSREIVATIASALLAGGLA